MTDTRLAPQVIVLDDIAHEGAATLIAALSQVLPTPAAEMLNDLMDQKRPSD